MDGLSFGHERVIETALFVATVLSLSFATGLSLQKRKYFKYALRPLDFPFGVYLSEQIHLQFSRV